MPIIPLMSYNVFTMMDETYWKGYPTAADPYTNPVPNWSNSRYMMVRLKPAQLSQSTAVAAGRRLRTSEEATPSTSRKRLAQFVLVVFIGISLTFFITHLTPIDPVEQMIASMTAFGDTSPEAIAMMREALRELYGIEGGLLDQYFTYWGRILVLDFGPSLSAFPTPVAVLIGRALPWTIGLLFTCTMLAWLLGNLLGGLAGYYRNSRTLKLLGVVAMGFHPVPYYIIAFVLLIVFGYLWPVLPISGGAAQNVPQGFTLDYIGSVLLPLDPAGAVDHPRQDRRLVPRHAGARLQHRHRGLRHLCRARRRAAAPHPAVLRDAQRAGAADHRPRDVARRDLQRRHHRRAGVQLSRASAAC